MAMPEEYVGREHTWLKHRVLQEYLLAWAIKLASVARRRKVRLWYIDCFSGPWRARNEELKDTSICIGLNAIESAVRTWKARELSIQVGAIFVEKSRDAFDELQAYLATRSTTVDLHPLHGTFGEHTPTIQKLVGGDAAFVFVDPTGWKGAAMQDIEPLVKPRYRDVLINVMFNDVNRFKEHPSDVIRAQIRDCLGVSDSEIPADLGEDDLMALYRSRLKAVCGLPLVAALAVPHPVHERTKLRLVAGGHDPEAMRVFRQAESKVIGAEAASVRAGAKDRHEEEHTGQLTLISQQPPETDTAYSRERTAALAKLQNELPSLLRRGRVRYRDLWPAVLESNHLTESDLKRLLWRLYKDGTIAIPNRTANERSLKDHHVIELPNRS
jgi:three-Cys-motif partner protein